MKTFIPVLIGILIIGVNNHSNAQFQYSLDSIITFSGSDNRQLKEIVTTKDAEGYPLSTEVYRFLLSGTTVQLSGKMEYTYFSDKSEKSFKKFDYYPNKDTCLLIEESEINEFGETILSQRRLLDVTDLPNFFEAFIIEGSIDTFTINANDRVLSKYHFGIASGDIITFKGRTDYFFNFGQKRDSAHYYKSEGNNLTLTLRTYFTYTPSGKIASIKYNDSSINEYNYDLIRGKERLTSFTRKEISATDTILNYKETYNYEDFFHNINFVSYSNGNVTSEQKEEIFLRDDMETIDSTTFLIITNTGDELKIDSKKYFYSNISSTSNYSRSSEFILFPNPSHNFLKIESNLNNSSLNFKYKIVDQFGALKSSGNYNGDLIDISNLSSGKYFLLLENKAAKPFVILR